MIIYPPASFDIDDCDTSIVFTVLTNTPKQLPTSSGTYRFLSVYLEDTEPRTATLAYLDTNGSYKTVVVMQNSTDYWNRLRTAILQCTILYD